MAPRPISWRISYLPICCITNPRAGLFYRGGGGVHLRLGQERSGQGNRNQLESFGCEVLSASPKPPPGRNGLKLLKMAISKCPIDGVSIHPTYRKLTENQSRVSRLPLEDQ